MVGESDRGEGVRLVHCPLARGRYHGEQRVLKRPSSSSSSMPVSALPESSQRQLLAFCTALLGCCCRSSWEATDSLNATSLATSATIRCAYALAVAECICSVGKERRALATALLTQGIPSSACLAASCMRMRPAAASVVGRLSVLCGPRLIVSAVQPRSLAHAAPTIKSDSASSTCM